MRKALTGIVTSLAVGAAISAQAAEELRGEALRERLAGSRTYCQTATGLAQADYHPDGTLALAHERGWSDTGTWWIDDQGRYCRQWNGLPDDATHCFAVSFEDDRIIAENLNTGEVLKCRNLR